MTPPTRTADLAEEAALVFRGQVVRLGGSTVSMLKPSDQTAIVYIESIILASDVLTGWVANEVTVELAPRERVQQGKRYEFYTHPRLFGDGLAVASLGHRPVPSASVSAGVNSDPAEARATRELRKHVEDAVLIVQGTVTQVRLPTQAVARGTHIPRSTKSPHWREAVIAVATVEKGVLHTKSVDILFASSRHIVWRNSPKLQPGDVGVILLHTATAEESADSTAAYTCLHAIDVQPVTKLDDIREYIRVTSLPPGR